MGRRLFKFFKFAVVVLFSATFLTGCSLPTSSLSSATGTTTPDDELVNGEMAVEKIDETQAQELVKLLTASRENM